MVISDNGIVYASSAMSGMPSLSNTAGSLIAVLDAVLPTSGFTKVFSDTNKAAYRSDEVGGVRAFLYIDDTRTDPALIRGYMDMSDISTGAGEFPTDAQSNGGSGVYKATGSGVSWHLYTDGRLIYFFCDAQKDNNWWGGFTFGDINSYVPNDAFGSLLIGTSNSGGAYQIYTFDVTSHAYLAGAYTQTGGSIQSARYSHSKTSNLGVPTSPAPGYPALAINGLHIAPVECWDFRNHARGIVPGLWNPIHNTTLTHGTVINDVPGFPGRSFRVHKVSSSYKCVIDTTGPWRDDGNLAITGKVTEKNVPGAYRVNLFRQFDMQLVRSTWSDANGNYAFTGLKEQKYVVMAIDHTNPLRSPAIQDNVIPS